MAGYEIGPGWEVEIIDEAPDESEYGAGTLPQVPGYDPVQPPSTTGTGSVDAGGAHGCGPAPSFVHPTVTSGILIVGVSCAATMLLIGAIRGRL